MLIFYIPDKGANLFTFNDHVLVVDTDTACFEPLVTEDVVKEWCKLAEMRWSFDWCAGKAQIRSHFVIMQGCMAILGLIVQHLPW